jgi:hypothetical protein
MVCYYTKEQDRKFSIYPKFGDKLNKKAQNVDKSLYTKYGYKKVNYNNICIVNIKECSCSCRCFLKNGIGLHSLGYSHLKDLNWFGPKFTVRSFEVAYNNKSVAKKGSAHSKTKAALVMDDK